MGKGMDRMMEWMSEGQIKGEREYGEKRDSE